ncbi:hypothetical protein [Acanthopleuribacter pedis]|uniref:Uncharacterized protein n=1 Tax=Acanthopleuribacter pedis TaxID=442870 RepID=A0A8J7QNE1_9BACT|nr:hypothetical protein [Acanthopleuribacter pedis]MBO1321220.1 hypothetical protein [Acanthopleuribacter pedis]
MKIRLLNTYPTRPFSTRQEPSQAAGKTRFTACLLLLAMANLSAAAPGRHQSLMTPDQNLVVAGNYQNGLRLEGEKIVEAGEGSGCFVAAYDAAGNLQWLRLLTNYPANTGVSLHQNANGRVTVILTWVNQSAQGDNETEVTVLALEDLSDGATIKTNSTPVEG